MKKLLTQIIGSYLNAINLISKSIGKKHVFSVFCYPFKVKLSPKQHAYLDKSQQEKLSIGDQNIQTYIWGNGSKKILFVHGWQSFAFRWKSYIDALIGEDYTIIAFDAPGHGKSDGYLSNVPLFERSLLAISKKHGPMDTIIAHSIGSFASIYFMDSHPKYQPKKMVSMASPADALDFVNFYIETLKLNDRTIKNLKEEFKAYTGHDINHFSIDNFFGQMKSKGLIIHDLDDKDTNVDYSRRIHELWSDSELILTKGEGHRLRSRKVLDKVISFVKNS